jgi:hypothetical protein
VVVPIAACAVVYLLLGTLFVTAWRRQPKKPENGVLIQHQLGLVGGAIMLFFGLPLVVTVIAVDRPPHPEQGYLPVLTLYALFVITGAPWIWETVRFGVAAGPDGIEHHSPWRGKRFFPWATVDRLSYAFGGWFTIKDADGRSARIVAIAFGMNEFLALCEQHLPLSALVPAKAGYKQIGRNFPG